VAGQTIGYARVSAADQNPPLATVHRLRVDATTAADALAALERALAPGRAPVSARTVAEYRRQAAAYVAWPGLADHPDAFVDTVGAEAAATAWRRHLLLERKLSPSSVNQGLAAVTLMYELCRIRIKVKRARVPKPGQPDALTSTEEGALQRAADRRGVRDSAVVALLLGSGARVEECARLDVEDLALTARAASVRLFGKGDEVRTVPLTLAAGERLRAWLREHPGGQKLWIGQRGPLTKKGLAKLIARIGAQAGLPDLHPHQLRHTYATRLREGRADLSQIQTLMGHASIETTARYVRPGTAELAALVERVLDA
jgi:integrase